LNIVIVIALLTIIILAILIACYRKFGANIYEPQCVLSNDEATLETIHKLEAGRHQKNMLALRIYMLYILAFTPAFFSKGKTLGLFTPFLLLCCVIYTLIALDIAENRIKLPPCPCCGEEDCLTNKFGRSLFLSKYCRRCNTVLIK